MPMHWDISRTALWQERESPEGKEDLDYFYKPFGKGIKMDLCFIFINWLYRKKIGSYCGRKCPAMDGIAVWEEQDSEQCKQDMLVDGSYSGSEEEWDREVAPILLKLAGMHVWANR